MSDGVTTVLERLADLGFQIRAGGLSPFGEPLPLVAGVAWDTRTAQIALIAEMQEGADLAEWQQLLFASAGLRHGLNGDGPAAFGPPVVIAIVDDDGWRRLRDLAEDLSANYILFNRVDLNLVRSSELANRERLDDALAPLLPRCRTLLGEEISRADVKRFWTMLRNEIRTAASGLDAVFAPYREHAGNTVADQLIAGDDDASELPPPFPLHTLSVRDFRSLREADIKFAPVTVIHGPNGGGKSSVLEAMELIWAGTSQRKPATVPPDEYARHLRRNGNTNFSITSDEHEVVTVADAARAELGRSVLTHESVAALVSESPEERYSALLATTGLEMPDLTARAQTLLDDAKRSADAALRAAGLPPLPRRDSIAVKHLRESLNGRFALRLPSIHDLVGAEEALSAASGGAFVPRAWSHDEHAAAALIRADTLIEELLSGSVAPTDVTDALDEAGAQIKLLVGPRREALKPLRRLVDLVREPVGRTVLPAREDPAPAPLSQELAVRWLAHAHALRDAATRFRSDAKALSDDSWSRLLRDYADALETAASTAPVTELEKLGRQGPARRTPANAIPAPDDVYSVAGFTIPPANPLAIGDAVNGLAATLQQHIDALERLAGDLESHPARSFHEHADPVLGELCRFELARRIRNAGPILTASERLVHELLHRRLAPLVGELVASIVRFEWYFSPLLVPDKGRKVVLGGLATSQADLDARLLLNSAERTALGIAWFLALHLLQPPERQKVLVLDDPTSAFDAPNQAGLISTLRAFARLTRPEQVVVATHDDAVAAVLAEEFAPVDDWPSGSVKLRCQRDSSDCSVVRAEPGFSTPLRIAREIDQLGLGEAHAVR
jgi:ABC-type hemin transport system ATPase subunit